MRIVLIFLVIFQLTSCVSTDLFTRKYCGASIDISFINAGTHNYKTAFIDFGKRKSFAIRLNKGGKRGESYFCNYIPDYYYLHFQRETGGVITKKIITPDNLPVDKHELSEYNITIFILLGEETQEVNIYYEIYKHRPYKINGKINKEPIKRIRFDQPREDIILTDLSK